VGAALIKCLLREAKNLCRHDKTPSEHPKISTSNQSAHNLRHNVASMMPCKTTPNAIFSSPNNALALSPFTSNKFGASTNEIRICVSEIETGVVF
jgi:hypothetical protein